MLIKPELVKKIKDYFNLNIYETKVWLALLSKGTASAGEIAELSGVPRSRTYDVLESLEKEGFAIEKVGKPTKYIAIKPKQILEKLKRKEMEKTKERIKILESLKDKEEYRILEELYNVSINPIKKEEITGAIKGKKEIYLHAREILNNAEKEVIVCMPALELIEKEKFFRHLFNKLKENNVSIKLILNGEDKTIKMVSKHYNIKTKKTDIKSKFFIIDRNEILFSLNPYENNEEIAIWLNSNYFAEAFARMFERVLKS